MNVRTTSRCCAPRVTSLWQTRMLRDARLTVADEIENALSYYRVHLSSKRFPRCTPILKPRSPSTACPRAFPPFLQMGSWIGGDRDGNPNVTAPTLVHAITRQATVIFEHYLEQVHKLGAELSVSNLLAGASDALLETRRCLPRCKSAHRMDEPYRRALIGVYSQGWWPVRRRAPGRGCRCRRSAVIRRTPYASATEFAADLNVLVANRLPNTMARICRAPRLSPLARAADVFGFHLASIDLRQSSDIHEAVIAELLARAGVQDGLRGVV